MLHPTETKIDSSAQASPAILLELLCGMMKTQAIHHAALLRLAEYVKDGPKSIQELAELTGTHASSLARLLRALASIGIFMEVEQDSFAQTPLSTFLLPDTPGSMFSIALLHGADFQWHVWEGFATSLQTGLPAFDTLYGMDMWQHFQQNPIAGNIFHNAMTGLAAQVNEAIATSSYDFASIDTLVDVGGGQGSLLTKLLHLYPTIQQGILFDQHAVTTQTALAELGKRCMLQTGDFFESVPEGADAYLLKQIIKDWDDEQCVQILRNCRRAMRQGGPVLVIETVLLPGKGSSHEKFIDLQLMNLLPGQERYEHQFRTLFEAAGLQLARIIPTTSPYSIMEAIVR